MGGYPGGYTHWYTPMGGTLVGIEHSLTLILTLGGTLVGIYLPIYTLYTLVVYTPLCLPYYSPVSLLASYGPPKALSA